MTAADRPSATDNARAEALAKERYPLREETNYHAGLYRGFLEGWAAGRAETTTATTEDAARVITAMGGPWADRTPLSIAQALADAGLLATARTHPTETTTEWGVRFYGRGPFDMPCEDRDDAEAEVDQVEDKHAPAVLIRREVTAWTEAD